MFSVFCDPSLEELPHRKLGLSSFSACLQNLKNENFLCSRRRAEKSLVFCFCVGGYALSEVFRSASHAPEILGLGKPKEFLALNEAFERLRTERGVPLNFIGDRPC